MKRSRTNLLLAALFLAFGSTNVIAQSEPSIALPPAEVILRAAAEMGVAAVDADYVLSKLPDLVAKSPRVFVIDARPARNYDEGHIPTAFNIYDAKFKLIYPEFEKLNVPKDAEIFLGIGRPCPMSLNDIKQLKEKGYTNLKAFVKGPVYFEKSYFEVTTKGAKKALGNGAALVNLRDEAALGRFLGAASDKQRLVVLAGDRAKASDNYDAAAKVYAAGFRKTAVFNGEIAEIQ